MIPAEARARFAAGLAPPSPAGATASHRPTSSPLFAQRNPQPGPVLDVSEPGAVSGPLLDGDARTDTPLYRVYVHGQLATETSDVRGRRGSLRRAEAGQLLRSAERR